MMNVDDNIFDTLLLQVLNISLEQRLAIDDSQRFGMFIRPGFKSCAEPGTEYH
jgi:hypothetical protein